MNEFGHEITRSARTRLGRPFRHHYQPDLCDGGTQTIEACMERGLSGSYDCSGLVIASICSVLGIPVASWPQQYRHTGQMQDLAQDSSFEPGDILLFPTYHGNFHIGIATSPNMVIHANGASRKVEESMVTDRGIQLKGRVIAAQSLHEVIAFNQLSPRVHPSSPIT